MANKKTSATIKKVLAQHRDRMIWIDEILRIKATVPVENQAEHVRNHSVEYYEGMAWGANSVIEEILMAYSCYAGFQNCGPIIVAPPKGDGPYLSEKIHYFPIVSHKHPDYKAWRRVYLERN